METYLFVYRVEGVDGLVKKLATANEIAKTIGCRDFNESYDFQVYNVTSDDVHRLYFYDCPKYHYVELLDRWGNVIDSGEYPEH